MSRVQSKIAINTFTGLCTDLDPASPANATKYNYAENIVMSGDNLGSVSNVSKTSPITGIDHDYDLISHVSIPGETIIITRSDNNTLLVHKVIQKDNLSYIKIATISGDFSKVKHISLESSIESDLIKKLYIADGVHQIMVLDIHRDETYGEESSWNIEYDVSDLYINKKGFEDVDISASMISGSLAIGKYFYVVREVSKSGSASDVVAVSSGVNIKKNPESGGYSDADTGLPMASRSGVRLTINFKNKIPHAILLYRVKYMSGNLEPSVNLIHNSPVKSSIITIDDISDSLVLTDEIAASVFYNQSITAAVLAKKDNILIAGNVSYDSSLIDDVGYDVRSFAFNRGGDFSYRNIGDQSMHHMNYDHMMEDSLIGRDSHDFIADDIYLYDRYRDVNHRYQGGLRNGLLVFGGSGLNVDYEFCHAHLIAAAEGDRRDQTRQQLYRNTSNPGFVYNDTNLKWINILKDDLIIKYGDKVRDIKSIPIKTQGSIHIDDVDLNAFGIEHHRGKLDYSNELIANTLAGYKRNEIYRFACKFTFENGTETRPMWISDIRFPANYIKAASKLISEQSEPFNYTYSFSAFEAPEDVHPTYHSFDVKATKPFDHSDSNSGIHRSELYVKPLGLKFKFKNLGKLASSGLKKIDIMYTPMDYTERTIVGQFAVGRIGLFSNTGQNNHEILGINEGACMGYSYPHPTFSMKYSYGIGPMIIYQANRVAGRKHPGSVNFSYDGYKELIRCTSIDGDLAAITPTATYDQSLMTTMSASSSPYFADFKNYLLSSPEITYIGRSYLDFLKLGNRLVFENIIYPKATTPFVLNNNDFSRDLYCIPVIGRMSNFTIGSSPGDHYITFGLRNIGLNAAVLETAPVRPRPSLMYSGAFLKSGDAERINNSDFVVYISLCGGINSSIMNGFSIVSDELGEQNVYAERVFTEEKDSVFLSNVYHTGSNFNEFGYSTHRSGLSVINPPINTPVSIKTFMSGPGYIRNSIMQETINFTSVPSRSFLWRTGANNVFDSSGFIPRRNFLNINESGRLIDKETNKLEFINNYYLNATTFKYFKSTINSQTNSLTPLDFQTATRHVSFIWQKGPEYSNVLRNRSIRTDSISSYNPFMDFNEINKPKSADSIFNVWDLHSLPITIGDYAGIQNEPTGPFELNQAVGSLKYVNYSKTLCHNLTGSRNRTAGSDSHLISPFYYDRVNSIYGEGEGDFNDNSHFSSLNLLNRGRIAGKHGAGVLVKIDDNDEFGTIPMIGHISAEHAVTKRIGMEWYNLNPGIKSTIDNPLYRLDQAVSTHNSTFLVDIRKPGMLGVRASYTDKINSKYIHTAQTITLVSKDDVEKDIYVFGGDTYVTLFDYTNTYPTYPLPGSSTPEIAAIESDNLYWNTRYYIDQQTKINSLVPIESFINTHVDAGYRNTKNLNPWDTNEPGMPPVNKGYSSPVIQRPIRLLGEHVYDSSYSAKRTFDQTHLNYSADPRFNKRSHPSRVIASEMKTYGETVDSFSVFKPNNYIDLNPSDGPITSIQTPLNRLYSFQPKAVNYLSLNERSLISDTTGAQLILGTGGVLPYAQRLSSIYGLSEGSMGAIKTIRDRTYFFDNELKSICILSEGVASLSESTGISNILKTATADMYSNIFPYDNNEHLIFKFKSISGAEQSLILNINNRAFESILTGGYDYGFDLNKENLYIAKNNQTSELPSKRYISRINKEQYMDALISYIVSPEFSITKIFDSASISLGGTHNNLANGSVEIDHKYENSIQNTGEFETTKGKYVNSEATLHLSIPRSYDKVSKTKVARMRDKYMNSVYRFKCNNKKISIPFTKTTYRYSYI